MIKRIELFNFMSHEHSVIDLAEGLTVLIGPNNCGKSSIVTALQVLCRYDSSKFMIRHGERDACVRIETDDDNVIEWSRTKSGSPLYKINGELFDRLNRTVPPQLHEALRMPLVDCDDEIDVHFGEQKSPVFLLNDRPTAAAQFFASTSDTIRLVEMQKLHRNQVKDRKRDQARLAEELAFVGLSIQGLDPVVKIRKEIEDCNSVYESLVAAATKQQVLVEFISTFQVAEHKLRQLRQQDLALSPLTDPPTQTDTASLERMIKAVSETEKEVQMASRRDAALRDLPSFPEIQPTEKLESCLAKLVYLGRESKRSSAEKAALNELEPPPQLQPETPIQLRLEKLVPAHVKVSQLARSFESLKNLVEPPRLIEEELLDIRIRAIVSEQKEWEKWNQELNQTQSLIEHLEVSIKEWADEHPECPTCRQSINRDEWLSEAGHRHG